MEVLYPRCCGLDVHKATVVACVRLVIDGKAVTKSHRFLLRLHLGQVDAIDAGIAEIDREVEAGIAPFRTAVEQVRAVPGIKSLAAQTILSEIGIDMSRFPSSAHLISWVCICPRSDESAGKRRSTRIRKGSPWLKTTLVQCAWVAARTKGSYLHAQFHRIRARRGPRRRSSPSPPPSSPPSITCSTMEPCITTSALTTSTHVAKSGRKTAWLNDWLTSAMLWNSPPSPLAPRPRRGRFLPARSAIVSSQ